MLREKNFGFIILDVLATFSYKNNASSIYHKARKFVQTIDYIIVPTLYRHVEWDRRQSTERGLAHFRYFAGLFLVN